MRADVYLVSTAAGNALSAGQSQGNSGRGRSRSVLHRLSKDNAFINTAADGLDSDAICVAAPCGREQHIDISAFSDRLRRS